MSYSEDEDDFQSADEDGFDDGTKPKDVVATISTIDSSDLNKPNQLLSQETSIDKSTEALIDKTKVIETFLENPGQVKLESSSGVEEKENREDDEGALTERSRERNLKVATNYSIEIAKTIQPSAPISVQGDSDIGFDVDDIEYPNIPGPEIQSSPPPPPTPSRSSSFNSESNLSQPTQCGWRISAKTKNNRQESTQSENSKSEQARLALDRLSEILPQSEKSLFERIAEDVKKVSITTGDRNNFSQAQSSGSDNSKGGSAIPLFSELSSSLGGWNWNGASKLLASASQMTSQVGSVLDSVVNINQNLPSENQPSSSHEKDLSTVKENCGSNSVVSQNKATMSANEANSNDALVDYTLNAMESLGKKAFGVMTERDQSGTLQIKGLGRPWEHLLTKKKEEEQLSGSANISNQPVEFESSNEPKKKSTVCYGNLKKIDQEEQKATLKYRKKRLDYSNDDKLD